MYKRDKLNYEMLTMKVIKTLRGSCTQLELSKMLGYSYNQYTKFESGLKVFRISDFFKVCEVLKRPLRPVFLELLGLEIELSLIHI